MIQIRKIEKIIDIVRRMIYEYEKGSDFIENSSEFFLRYLLNRLIYEVRMLKKRILEKLRK